MDIKIPASKYVVAVSGGVDSVALLDILAQRPKLELVVAHFNHGIRSDSGLDEQLVIELAYQYNLAVEVGYGNLGEAASEDLARQKRYEFLNSVAVKHKTKGIITAHHQDDLIETAFINIIRGSGPRGLSAMSTNVKILRPLINIPKKELVGYAKKHNLNWREDSTNRDTKYLRNYVRWNILETLSEENRQELLKNIDKVAKIHSTKEQLLATLSHTMMKNSKINRAKFKLLPSDVANELIVYWLRNLGVREFDKKTIDRLNIALKTALPATKHSIKNDFWIEIDPKTAQLIRVP